MKLNPFQNFYDRAKATAIKSIAALQSRMNKALFVMLFRLLALLHVSRDLE